MALSARLPIQRGPYSAKRAKPYLFGLLLENEDARAACSDQLGVSVDDAFGILAVMGWDCPGAVQFCREEDLEELRTRKGEYRPIRDTEIAERIRALVGDEPSWAMPGEHWSLGGQQEKFALARIDGCWHTAHGAPPPRTSSSRGSNSSTTRPWSGWPRAIAGCPKPRDQHSPYLNSYLSCLGPIFWFVFR